MNRRALNFLLLLASFAGAQGLLLVAQTYLIARSHADIVGHYGTSYAIAFLGYQTVDWGAHFYLSREVMHRPHSAASEQLTTVR